jgi:hypothetical protein
MGGDAKIERERRWRGHLLAWRNSGLSQAAYCRRTRLTENDFSWWKREIARRDRCAGTAAPAFVPVQVSAPQSLSYAFEVSLRGGRVLRFDARIDPAMLGAVVRVLEAAVPQPGVDPC